MPPPTPDIEISTTISEGGRPVLPPTPEPRQDPEMDNFIYGGGPPRPRASHDPNVEVPGHHAPWWRWIFYVLAIAAIPLRLWWEAPLWCAHFGWFCR